MSFSSALLVAITPTAFILVNNAMLRPKPLCGAGYTPPMNIGQNRKVYVLTTGRNV